MAIAAGAGIAAVGSIAGGAMSSKGAKDAAGTQAEGTKYAADLQQKQFDQIRQDLAPYMGAGQTGLMALMGMLGLPSSGASVGGNPGMTEEQLREKLLPQYTTSAGPSGNPPSLRDLGIQDGVDATWGYDPQKQKWGYQVKSTSGGDSDMPYSYWRYADQYSPGSSTVDEAGLQAAIQREMAGQSSQNQQAYGSMSGLGQLLQTPFGFDASNLENTPGYQFTMNQGLKSLANMNAAKGLGLSGAQQKGALEYATGLADNTYGQQYQRALQQYTTNYGIANDMYSRLMGLTAMGQNSAAGVGNMGMQSAGNIGNLVAQGANAQAAGQVASSNAWGNAINGLGNAGMMYSLMQPQSSGGGGLSSLYGGGQARLA